MNLVGIRGAVQAKSNSKHEIRRAARRLMEDVLDRNHLDTGDVVSVILTMTPDLNADFPASAARAMTSWRSVPLLCAAEVAVPKSMPRVIRLLMHARWDRPAAPVRHRYLGKTARLRPDLAGVEAAR